MDYQGNSNKARRKQAEKEEVIEEPKVVEKLVLETEVITRKPPLAERFKNVFLGADVESVARYVGSEVLLPALRNLLVDATTKGIERMVYGDSNLNRNRPQSYGPRITYNRPVNRSNILDPRANLPDQPSRPRARATYQEIILGTRSDAELVLERLSDIIETYSVVSVADLYAIVGLNSTHVDNKWGWENVRQAEIRQIREGYLLDLPPAEPLN